MWKNDAGMELKELVTNQDRKRQLEKIARTDADFGQFRLPHENITGDYARQAFLEAENSVYLDAYHTRHLRNRRRESKV